MSMLIVRNLNLSQSPNQSSRCVASRPAFVNAAVIASRESGSDAQVPSNGEMGASVGVGRDERVASATVVAGGSVGVGAEEVALAYVSSAPGVVAGGGAAAHAARTNEVRRTNVIRAMGLLQPPSRYLIDAAQRRTVPLMARFWLPKDRVSSYLTRRYRRTRAECESAYRRWSA